MLAIMALVTGVSQAVFAEEQSTTVTQDQIPQKVAETIRQYGKSGKFIKAVKTDEDGLEVYEITLQSGGKKIEVQTTLDGEMNMCEEAQDASALPKAALDSVNKQCLGSKIKSVEKSIRTIYEVRVAMPDGKTSEILVTPGGQIVSTSSGTDNSDMEKNPEVHEEKD